MTLVAFCKHCGKKILPTFDEKGDIIDWSCPDCRPVGSRRSKEVEMVNEGRCPYWMMVGVHTGWRSKEVVE